MTAGAIGAIGRGECMVFFDLDGRGAAGKYSFD